MISVSISAVTDLSVSEKLVLFALKTEYSSKCHEADKRNYAGRTRSYVFINRNCCSDIYI